MYEGGEGISQRSQGEAIISPSLKLFIIKASHYLLAL